MAQWISIEEAAAKYGFETEYIWVLIEIREITVDYQRADIDIIDDESIQDFINRNKKGITLMYIEKLERYCMDKSQVCSIYASLLGKQDKEITMYKGAKFLYDALQGKWLKPSLTTKTESSPFAHCFKANTASKMYIWACR